MALLRIRVFAVAVLALLAASCDRTILPAACAQDDTYVLASGYLGKAQEQVAMGDHRRANILLRDGLEVIGNPFDPDALDDSDLRLSAARDAEWNDKLAIAANLRAGVLESRLETYARVGRLEDCPSPAENAVAGPPRMKRRV